MTLQDAINLIQSNRSDFAQETRDDENTPTQYFVQTSTLWIDKTDADNIREAMNLIFDAVNDNTLHT